MATENKMMVRQGDLLFILRSTEINKNTKKPRLRKIILAQGETTGHAHIAIGRGVKFRNNELFVPEEAEIRHEEHKVIQLTKGVWEVRRQVEWIPLANRFTPVSD